MLESFGKSFCATRTETAAKVRRKGERENMVPIVVEGGVALQASSPQLYFEVGMARFSLSDLHTGVEEVSLPVVTWWLFFECGSAPEAVGRLCNHFTIRRDEAQGSEVANIRTDS